jgi:hypothetical protein
LNDPSDPSDSDSEDYFGSTGTTTSDKENNRSKKKRSKKYGKKKHRRHRSHTSEFIKPIPPKEYNGSVNLRVYYRFVREGEAYLRDSKVRNERQLRILAHYLDGKAYNFYIQKVAPEDPKDWDLHKFFTELYNYCFPIDYKQRTRLKLEKLHQGSDKRVSEYIHELQELFSMLLQGSE